MSQSIRQSALVETGSGGQIGFSRLVAVEIRKLADTRSSLAIFAVLAVIAAALVVGFAIVNTGQRAPITFAGLAGSIGLFAGYYPLLRGRTGQFWAKVVAAAALALTLQFFVFLLSAIVPAAFGVSGMQVVFPA